MWNRSWFKSENEIAVVALPDSTSIIVAEGFRLMLKSSKGYPPNRKKPSVMRFKSAGYKNLHMALKIPKIFKGGQCSEAAHEDLRVSNTLRSYLVLSRNPYRALCCLGQPGITGSRPSKLDEENHRKNRIQMLEHFSAFCSRQIAFRAVHSIWRS
jgi:hypothetical protein